MGVLNVTPDSFSDGGRYAAVDAAVAAARQMVAAGAAIIDVGGESTRPGAADVSAEQEMARVLPVIEALQDLPAVISIDTSKARVIRAAAARGAGLLNDVRALREPAAMQAAADSGAAVCLMHMQGAPRTMQQAPTYDDVVIDVKAFLSDRVRDCVAAGMARDRLVVDPGFGFGKTLQHNLLLLAALASFEDLGLPVLVGLSRKSMIGTLTGRAVEQRLAGSIVMAALAVERGARIVRAHDVEATVDALRIVAALGSVESRGIA